MKYLVLAPIGGTRRFPHEIGEVVSETDLVIPAKKLVEDGFLKEISDEEADDLIAKQKEKAETEGVPFEKVNPSAVPDEQFAVNTELLSHEQKVNTLNFEPDLTEAEKVEMQKVKDEELAALKKQEEADLAAKLEAEKAEGGNGEGGADAEGDVGLEGITKKQIIAALEKAGVAFDKTSNKTELYEKYKML